MLNETVKDRGKGRIQMKKKKQITICHLCKHSKPSLINKTRIPKT